MSFSFDQLAALILAMMAFSYGAWLLWRTPRPATNRQYPSESDFDAIPIISCKRIILGLIPIGLSYLMLVLTVIFIRISDELISLFVTCIFFIPLFALYYGVVLIRNGLTLTPTPKEIREGIADEDGWSGNAIDLKKVGTGVFLVLLFLLCTGVFTLPFYTSSPLFQSENYKIHYAIKNANYQFRKAYSKFPATRNDFAPYLDSGQLNAIHDVDQKPVKSLDGYFYCLLFKKDDETGAVTDIALYAYPEVYNRKRRIVFYHTFDSDHRLYFTADIADLFPGIEYGDPVPIYRDYIPVEQLPKAFH